MPIIENPNAGSDFRHNFIFIENDILLQETSFSAVLMLPDQAVMEKCLDLGIVQDHFSESDKGYSAAMLKNDSPLPLGSSLMPLREFFWESKSQAEKESASLSALGGLAARAHGFLRLRQTYLYCPKCGTLLKPHEKEIAKVCPSCGRIDFPRIEPAIIVLVKKGDEILLVKSKTVKHNFYSCVAGFVEHGESLEQCVAREVMEETGLEIENICYAGSQPWPFPDQLMVAFTADYKSGQIKIQESEIEAAAWFHKDHLPEIPKPGSVAYNLISGKF